MKALLMLSLAGFSAWVAYKFHREAQLNELPTAEHKKLWWQQVLDEDRRRREALSA